MRKLRLAGSMAFVLALAGNDALAAPKHVAEDADQRIQAIKKGQAENDRYYEALSTAFEQEKREDLWASKQERELRKSFVDKKVVGADNLKSIECRSSRCALVIERAADAKEDVEQIPAVSLWLGGTTTCGYTVLSKPGGDQKIEAVRVFLHCDR